MDKDESGALRGRHERDGHRVRRERRPWLILQLWHVSTEIALDHALLLGGNDEIRALDLARDAEARETHEGRAKMFDAGIGDAQLRTRHGGNADERSDFNVIRADAMRGSDERASTFDRQLVRADAFDLGAERNQEVT